MTEPGELLNKIPKKTPVWAVGIVTVIVAVVTSLVTLYIVAKEDISKSIVWAQASHDAQVKADDIHAVSTIEGVLKIVNVNMQALAELNKALGVAQVQAASLSVRVSDLERAVDRLSASLTNCENSLASCLDAKTKSKP
jgi:hypothetical protein